MTFFHRGLLGAALLAAFPALGQAFSDPGTGVGAAAGWTRGREADAAGVSAAVEGRLRLTGALGVEGTIGYRRDVFDEAGQRVLTVNQIPVQASLQVFFLYTRRVQPYLLGGGTYVLVMSKGHGPSEGFGRTESKIGLHGGLGVDVRVAPRKMVHVDARYVSLDYDFGPTLVGRRGSYLTVSAGFDLLF